jgi:hypothetical protein
MAYQNTPGGFQIAVDLLEQFIARVDDSPDISIVDYE